MRLKKGVKIGVFLDESIINLFPMLDRLCAEYSVEFVITSGVEGRHKRQSKHYDGKAIDIRSREFEGGSTGEVCRSFVERLQAEIGHEYFVLQENDHIHLQYNL